MVRISTCTPGSPSLIAWVASTPFSFGMLMSMTTTWGASLRASRTASSPSSASPTTSKSGCASRIIRMPSRTMAWSSAMRIFTLVAVGCAGLAIGRLLTQPTSAARPHPSAEEPICRIGRMPDRAQKHASPPLTLPPQPTSAARPHPSAEEPICRIGRMPERAENRACAGWTPRRPPSTMKSDEDRASPSPAGLDRAAGRGPSRGGRGHDAHGTVGLPHRGAGAGRPAAGPGVPPPGAGRPHAGPGGTARPADRPKLLGVLVRAVQGRSPASGARLEDLPRQGAARHRREHPGPGGRRAAVCGRGRHHVSERTRPRRQSEPSLRDHRHPRNVLRQSRRPDHQEIPGGGGGVATVGRGDRAVARERPGGVARGAGKVAKAPEVVDPWLALLAGAGALLSGYLVLTKALHAPAYCPPGSGCDIVRASRFGAVFGVPVSIFGLLFYGALLLLALRRMDAGARWALVFPVASVGVAASAVFIGVQQLAIRATCSLCLISAFLSLAILLLALFRRQRPAATGTWLWSGAAALAGGGFLAAGYAASAPQPAATTYADGLAKHLAASGGRLYGAYWCPHCQDQKELFGRAAKALAD